MSRTEASAAHIDQAAREGQRPSIVDIGAERVSALLHTPRPRVVPLPEPVERRSVSGRPPGGFATCWPFCLLPPADGGWEIAALTEARMRERAAEAALLGGLT